MVQRAGVFAVLLIIGFVFAGFAGYYLGFSGSSVGWVATTVTSYATVVSGVVYTKSVFSTVVSTSTFTYSVEVPVVRRETVTSTVSWVSTATVTNTVTNVLEPWRYDRSPPMVRGFGWDASRVINDKIYDIGVWFSVFDDRSPIAYVELRFIPERYYYFITGYGMRPEDYDRVFPPEGERTYILKPVDGGFDELEEDFEVEIRDIVGGREYRIIVIARDLAGNVEVFETKTPYIRQYENLGKILLEKGIIVAASYMSSSQPFKEKLDDYPILGRYTMPPDGPIDDIVLWKHVDWAGYAGINVFFIDAGAWEKWKLEGYEGEIMKKLMDRGIKCAFMWYAWLGDDRYFVRGTNKDAPDWTIDLTYPKNKESFVNLLTSILNSGLVDHPNYFRIDGRPVIFIYDATVFINETEAWNSVFNSVRVKPYVLGDIVHAVIDPYEMNKYFYSKWKDLGKYDAISSWVGFVGNEASNPRYNSNPNYWFKLMNELWYRFSLEISKQYVASISPGFKRYYENVGIPRNIEEFRERILDSLKYTKFLRIDTWNDFAEGTFIEPSQKEGLSYIETLAKTLSEYIFKASNK
ncbi:MAG: hypothetical protein QXP97_07610 [Desulfurococcus sp.]|uniref:hypothetical protein n=1 Tax=Desulfurococcus sp. TaxID=51678 RepID=UPI003160D4C1